MTPVEFLAKWAAEAEAMRRRSAMVSGADLCLEILADFEVLTAAEDAAELTLDEAAKRSGYSRDHLRRLHRLGKVPARRHGRRLQFRIADLPRKPNTLAGPRLSGYDPAADARQVATRRDNGVAHG